MLYAVFSECTALPDNILNLKTSTQLPVQPDTLVSVECEPGYILAGSYLILCVQDTIWASAGNLPHCFTLGINCYGKGTMFMRNIKQQHS